jgi:hypothetical protein
MKITRKVGAPMVAGGIALSGLFGLGLGTAAADPGQRCGVPNTPACRQAPQNGDWQHRDIGQARKDRQPFTFNGQRVQPLPAGNGDGWGFWLLGKWMRL